MNGHYDVFDVMRLKNEIFKSEDHEEKMGVVFWNHGKGSVYGVCFDDNYEVASKEKSIL